MDRAALLAIFGAGGALVLAALKPSTRGIIDLFKAPAQGLADTVEDTVEAIGEAVSSGVDVLANLPRGIRNNNPGNIRTGQPWQGLSDTQTDPAFDQFITPEYGIRALGKLLTNYQTLSGINTLAGLISRFAPSSENNTQAYINSVAAQTGIDPDARIDVASNLSVLIPAIIQHENGQQPYDAATIFAGIALI